MAIDRNPKRSQQVRLLVAPETTVYGTPATYADTWAEDFSFTPGVDTIERDPVRGHFSPYKMAVGGMWSEFGWTAEVKPTLTDVLSTPLESCGLDVFYGGQSGTDSYNSGVNHDVTGTVVVPISTFCSGIASSQGVKWYMPECDTGGGSAGVTIRESKGVRGNVSFDGTAGDRFMSTFTFQGLKWETVTTSTSETMTISDTSPYSVPFILSDMTVEIGTSYAAEDITFVTAAAGETVTSTVTTANKLRSSMYITGNNGLEAWFFSQPAASALVIGKYTSGANTEYVRGGLVGTTLTLYASDGDALPLTGSAKLYMATETTAYTPVLKSFSLNLNNDVARNTAVNATGSISEIVLNGRDTELSMTVEVPPYASYQWLDTLSNAQTTDNPITVVIRKYTSTTAWMNLIIPLWYLHGSPLTDTDGISTWDLVGRCQYVKDDGDDEFFLLMA